MSVKGLETSPASGPAIAFSCVSKSFGPVAALRNISFEAQWASIHALTGENGAGKSTLMKLLSGVFKPGSGQMRLDGAVLDLANPAAARRAGISTVFQELTVLPNLTIAENIYLGRELASRARLDRRAMREGARAILSRLGIELDVDTICANLTIAEQQMLEIAKGIGAQARIFIFDEPTAALNAPEVGRLKACLRLLRAEGKLLFYISHRLEEIFELCDWVTVLKDGELVSSQPAASLDHAALVRLMVGRPLETLFPPRRTGEPDTPALDVSELRLNAQDAPVHFRLLRGEILGFAGLEGQGQREIMRALAGSLPAHKLSGSIEERGSAARPLAPMHNPAASIAQGIGFMPGDRKGEGLYLPLSVERNIALGRLGGMRLRQTVPASAKIVSGIAQALHLRAAGLDQPVGALSGGNQQKVMLGRWLAAEMNILLIEEPTRGVDIGAKAEIYHLLRKFAEAGGAVLIASSDLPEILGVCDRILVVRNRTIAGAFPGEGTSEADVMAVALGTAPLEHKQAR